MLEIREHLVREKWIQIEKAKIIKAGEGQVVLPRRRHQPSPEVSTPCPTISRLH
ncbi:hypothetical protein SO802_004805 [Lithocarpus litseifolius]|uniref:Uncharacterized protein n=1 Tax=Lithocarpus litseifolius TaxID=425828 RepID=A0AAW2DGD2_9ROSI